MLDALTNAKACPSGFICKHHLQAKEPMLLFACICSSRLHVYIYACFHVSCMSPFLIYMLQQAPSQSGEKCNYNVVADVECVIVTDTRSDTLSSDGQTVHPTLNMTAHSVA
jgi:hypothetical protein